MVFSSAPDMERAVRRMVRSKHEQAKMVIEMSNSHFLSDASGLTLLHHSAATGNEDVAQYLVDKGCNVNIQDKFGRTALMLAVMGNHEAIVNVLLKAKADINIRHYGNETVLNIAFRHPQISDGIIRLFLIAVQQQFPTSEGAANSLILAGCSLAQAISLGDSAKALIESMVLQGSPVNSRSVNNKTPLHLAIEDGHLKIAKVLLENGANPKALDICNASPIYYLYVKHAENSNEQFEILKILLDSGVSLMSLTVGGIFQISCVLMKGDRKAIRAVLQSDVDFNAQDKIQGKSILHYIALNSNDGVVEEVKLYSNKWNFNLLDNFQMNPLVGAVMIGNPNMVKYLLEQRSKVNLINTRDGIPVIFYAYAQSTKKDQYDQCAELLFQYNADPAIVCNIKNTQMTLMDLAMKDNNFNRMKTVTARLAMIKNLGTPITGVIYSKIKSHRLLKRHFKECRGILKKKISRSRKVLELLTDRKQKIAKYLDDQLVKQLNCFRIKNRVKIVYPYYCSVIEKQYYMAKEYREAAAAICKIFGDKISTDHLATEAIIKYLDDKDLQVLSHMYRERPFVSKSSNLTVQALTCRCRNQTASGTFFCTRICPAA